ncbi:MAG: agmatine deiminase family protein [Candidatus Peregrinibacteria bacterium]
MNKYIMPAEWESHEATWLSWPHYEPHWPGKLELVPYVYAEIIRALIPSEKVYVCVNDAVMEKEARRVLAEKNVSFADGQVRFFHIPTNASWIRDNGPIFVRDDAGKLVITDWIHNAWGGQWPYELDDVVPQKVGAALDIPVIQTHRVLEGGSIDVNGKGTLLTTEQCLLNLNRNPGMNKTKIEAMLREHFGATHVLWLKDGVVGDDTSGHVDDIARFVNETTVVCAVEKNKADENYQALQNNFDLLKTMTDQDEKPFTVIPLPMPAPVIHQNRRLPASYANFYIGNTRVLVPTFCCPQDERAIEILKPLFPGREIMGIDCTDLIWGLGALHCSTQQQPKK